MPGNELPTTRGDISSSFKELTGPLVRLTTPLTVRFGQGFTARQIDVAVDGLCSVTQLHFSLPGQPRQVRKLSEGELQSLCAILTEEHQGYTLATLPDTIGRRHVNCPTATITMGVLNKTAYLRVDGEDELPTAEARAFRELVKTILAILPRDPGEIHYGDLGNGDC